MVVWKIAPGNYKAAVEHFLKTGGAAPAGVKTLGRWHVPGSTLGWHLIEASDMTALALSIGEWGELIEMETYPVIEDAEAGAAALKVYGK
jgi:hypothetical protein